MLASETDSWFVLVSDLIKCSFFDTFFFIELFRFIGVIIYSGRWNHFWQFNKTVALTLSYIYSCINPFALYFLSSTFRHFYKRYLFFWTKGSCCRPKNSNYASGQSRRTLDGVTFSDCPRRTSVNNGSMLFIDLMKIRSSSLGSNNNTLIKTSPNRTSTGNGSPINANGVHWFILNGKYSSSLLLFFLFVYRWRFIWTIIYLFCFFFSLTSSSFMFYSHQHTEIYVNVKIFF